MLTKNDVAIHLCHHHLLVMDTLRNIAGDLGTFLSVDEVDLTPDDHKEDVDCDVLIDFRCGENEYRLRMGQRDDDPDDLRISLIRLWGDGEQSLFLEPEPGEFESMDAIWEHVLYQIASKLF